MSRLGKLFATFLLGVYAHSGFSAPIFYSDRDAFLQDQADLIVHIEDFEDASPFGARVGGAVDQFSYDGWRVESDIPALKLMARSYSGNHNTSHDGRQYLSIDTDLSRRGTRVHWSADVSIKAFGFNLIDHDGDDVRLNVEGVELLIPEVGDAGVAFFGVVFDDPIAQIGFWLDSGRDAQISVDDWITMTMPAVAQVDEPQSLSLLILGLLGMCFGRSRRNKKADLCSEL